MVILLSLPETAPSKPYVEAAIGDALRVSETVTPEQVVIAAPGRQFGPRVRDLAGEIANADLVIADVSGRNANVMVEVGAAKIAKKPILLLTSDAADIPYDLREHRTIFYSANAPDSQLISRIAEALDAFILPSGAVREEPTARKRRKVFISYAHADAQFLTRILVHLKPLEREGVVDLWSDTKLQAGARWRDEIRAAIDEAAVAILLISADFLASEFVVSNELPPLLDAAQQRGTQIIPVIVKPSRFLRDERLSRFQAVNDPTKPLIALSEADQEHVYAMLAERVELDVDSSPQ